MRYCFLTDAELVQQLKERLRCMSRNYAKPLPYERKLKKKRGEVVGLYIESSDDWDFIANKVDSYPRHVVLAAYNGCVRDAETNPNTSWRELEFFHLLWHR